MAERKDTGWPYVKENGMGGFNPGLNWPSISIITPSYMQGAFLEETILSVINQEYPNLEYIVMDGGSSDESVEIIKKYAERITYWESKKDRGQTHAINKGLEQASGDIIGYLNSDDCLMPGALLAVGKAYLDNYSEENNKLVFSGDACAGTRLENSVAAVRRGINLQPMPMVHGYGICAQPATLWTRNSLFFDESLRFTMDFDYWVKLSLDNYKVIEVDETIAFMRSHPDSKSSTLTEVMWLELSYLPFRHSYHFKDLKTKLWAIQAYRYKFTTYLRHLLEDYRKNNSRKEYLQMAGYAYKMFPHLLFDLNFLKFNIKILAKRIR